MIWYGVWLINIAVQSMFSSCRENLRFASSSQFLFFNILIILSNFYEESSVVIFWQCSLTLCSSIHDHTESHCFMKLLQGQLKETLFEWPESKSHGDMVQKSQRILQENKVAYINGEKPNCLTIFFKPELVLQQNFNRCWYLDICLLSHFNWFFILLTSLLCLCSVQYNRPNKRMWSFEIC